MECCRVCVFGRSEPFGDLDSPRQVRGGSEQLLVEVVSPPSNPLGERDPYRSRVEDGGDISMVTAKHPHPDDHACGQAAVESKATFPDGENAPEPIFGDPFETRKQ